MTAAEKLGRGYRYLSGLLSSSKVQDDDEVRFERHGGPLDGHVDRVLDRVRAAEARVDRG